MKEPKSRREFKPMWALTPPETPDTLDLYIYGDVEAETWVDNGSLWGTYKEAETSANHFREVLGQYPDAAQINIYINSYGGSVFEGTAIYNQLRRHPAHKTVYVDGFACSIASVIAMAGDEVIMPRNSLMMIHNMWLCACGNAAELRKAAEDLDVINAAGRGAYLLRAGEKLNEEQLTEMMAAETWLSAEDCIRYGLADRFAGSDADMSGAAEVLQKANLNLQQRISFQKSLAAQLRQLTEGSGQPEKRRVAPSAAPSEVAARPEEWGGNGGAGGMKNERNSVMALFRNFD